MNMKRAMQEYDEWNEYLIDMIDLLEGGDIVEDFENPKVQASIHALTTIIKKFQNNNKEQKDSNVEPYKPQHLIANIMIEDFKYLNRLNKYEFVKLIWDENYDDMYEFDQDNADAMWALFRDSPLKFFWQSGIKRRGLVLDYIARCKWGDAFYG
jgi:hypothetical protein|tara:strand:- start:5 stop:466 length:462 start_codon:yes stop_codon:yes gene_type:complete